MEEIKKTIKKEDLSVLFFWANGCQACEKSKPIFQQMIEKFPENNLLNVEFSKDSYEFYSKFAEKIHDQEPVLDQNGENVLDDEGIPKMKFKYDNNGKPVMTPKVVVPIFFVFSKEKQNKDNPFGFIGSMDGHNPEKLFQILLAMKFKKQGKNLR